MARLFKITGPAGESIHGGSGAWSLPTKGKPGKWMPKVENVVACNRGYHLIPAIAIVDWLPRAPQSGVLWEAEGRGALNKDGDKIAFAQARLLKRVGVLDEVSMRLVAADMAERVLPIFSKVFPNDKRPARAIQAARDFAHGKIGGAAMAAAKAAAVAAAAAAAAAKDATGDAAWAAAMSAAGAAAKDAAMSAAAGAAAMSAAGAAAEAANAKIIIAQAKAAGIKVKQ